MRMEVKDTFLEKILQSKRKRLEAKLNRDASLDEIRARAHDAPPGLDLYQILSENEHLSLIAEIKRASPSKGIIRADLDPASQARAYQDFGASALSVLTEEDFFHGSLEDLKKAKEACHLPVLRKDFIFHAYQIYEARAWGADAVLLIAAMLSKQDLLELAALAQRLGMDPLVEVHREEEIPRALGSGARIIGINNRDLTTFHVSLQTTERLARFVPKDRVLVSESGIKGVREAEQVGAWGAKAILVGEALVRATDLEGMIRGLTQIPIVCG